MNSMAITVAAHAIGRAGYFVGVPLWDKMLKDDLKDRYREKMPRVLMLLTHFLRDLLVSNLRVAYDVLTPTHYMRPAVVAVPLRAKTDGAITILANMISLTPGTLSLDVSSDRSVLYLHVMYLDNEDDLREQIHKLEDRVLAVLE